MFYPFLQQELTLTNVSAAPRQWMTSILERFNILERQDSRHFTLTTIEDRVSQEDSNLLY